LESNFKLETFDNFKIHGIVNSTKDDADKAVFIVHGMAGHMYEYVHKCAANFFQSEYDVYRFNFYSLNSDARKLVDCDLSTHVKDFETILNNFSDKYKEIYIIGHSYGGPVIMNSKMPSNAKCISLWDPSFALNSFGTWDCVELKGRKLYIMPMSIDVLINEQMYKDIQMITREYCLDKASNFKLPVQVVHGTRDLFGRYDESYNSRGNPQNIREYIKDAKHNFANEDHAEILLNKTKDWFKSY